MKALILVPLLLLAGCASSGLGPDGAPVDVRGAETTQRKMDNGDTVDEYRVGGQLRMVKVTPARGPAYYLYDRNGDGHMEVDGSKDNVSPVYWKLYSW
ncbi:DUF2782 domain-containing protein [Xanthomonas sacchari]|uniref:DUF2782 domain-containing protein n=1 Tax=Xanthomonas sacchari TaxID=56458 RepID=UPI0005822110|nr:DUF2782 domain-containing protein [Xanthomonas sacchari]AJC46413.1 hypothetical protein SB85_12230 [Xanthomonas sacchari]